MTYATNRPCCDADSHIMETRDWIANFADLIVVMTNGGPADRTQIVASYIFTQAFRRLDFGYASAIAVVLLLLLMAYALLIVLLRRSSVRPSRSPCRRPVRCRR